MPSGTRPLPGRLSLEVTRILSDAIADRGVTQAEVATAAGMSASQLSRTLDGQKPLTLEQLEALCEALGDDVVRVISTADAAMRSDRLINVSPLRRRDVGTPAEDDLYLAARAADPEPTDEQPSYDDPS